MAYHYIALKGHLVVFGWRGALTLTLTLSFILYTLISVQLYLRSTTPLYMCKEIKVHILSSCHHLKVLKRIMFVSYLQFVTPSP